MARNLRLEVLMQAVDRVTGPMRRMRESNTQTAESIRASRSELRRLEAAQRDMRSYRELAQRIRSTNHDLSENQRRIAALSREIANTSSPTREMIRERDAMIRQSRELSARQQEEQRRFDQLRNSINSVDGTTGSLRNRKRQLAEQINEVNSRLRDQQSELERTARTQERLNAVRTNYQQTHAAANSMIGTGARATALAAGAGYAAARQMAPGIDFEASMSNVQALTRLDAADPQLEALRAQLRELGATTSFSATQAADAAGFLAMAGFDPRAIMDAMPGMLDLSRATNTELARTADITSNIMGGFGLDASEMQRVGDVLVATATRANVNLEMLGESMKYVGPVARDMGVSLEESAAMAGLLGDVGIQGSQAGTSMRAIISALTRQTGAAREAMEALGVETRDSEGNLRSVPRIISDIAAATQDMGSAERGQYLQEIFGREPAAAIAELINQQGAAGIDDFVAVLRDASGEAARVASIMDDNTRGDLAAMGSAWQELGIITQDVAGGPLRELIQGVTGVIRTAGEWMKENPELTSNIIKWGAAIIGIIGGLGALLMIMGMLLKPIALIIAAIKVVAIVFAALSWPVLAVIAVIGALVGAFVYMWRNWDQISGWLSASWDWIKSAAGAFWDWLGGLFTAGVDLLANLFMNWSLPGLIFQHWESIKSAAQAFWDWFTAIPSATMDAVSEALGGWNPLSVLATAWDSVRAFFAGLPAEMSDVGSAIISGVIGGITGRLSDLRDTVVNTASNVTGWFRDVLGINSPSRVFADHGADTLAGYEQGVEQNEHSTLSRITDFARQVAAAGAGIAISGISAASNITWDTQPPVSAAQHQPAAGDHIEIHIHAAPADTAQDLAQQIQLILDQRDREKARRQRASLEDRG